MSLLAVAADINSKTSIGTALVNIANDIDMADKTWTPFIIGKETDSIKTFTIDGNGYTISHLKAEDAAKSLAGVGFIGEIRSNEANVEVRNLTVDSANFSDMSDYSTACAGGIAGYIDGGPSVKFINCHVTGSMIKSGKFAGGIFAWNGTNVKTTILVDGCTVEGSEISGTLGSSGGIVGHACASSTDTLNIKDSSVTGTKISGVYKGNIIGTVNAGTVSIENTKYHDNTSVNNDRYVGRVAFGETGSLTIDGVKVTEAQ